MEKVGINFNLHKAYFMAACFSFVVRVNDKVWVSSCSSVFAGIVFVPRLSVMGLHLWSAEFCVRQPVVGS